MYRKCRTTASPVIKSQVVEKPVNGPQFFGRTTRTLARFIVHRLESFVEFLGRCRRPLAVSNALARLCIACFIPKTQAVKVANSSKICGFWTPICRGGDTPDFGHTFSNRTHFRGRGTFWFSYIRVERAQRVAEEKRRQKN